MEHRARVWNRPCGRRQDSNTKSYDICKACDSRAGQRPKLACQGLHNETFLSYGSSYVERSAAACPSMASKRPPTCCRPAGRMNARTADHAEAWLQEMDRLGAARECGGASSSSRCR